MDGEGGLTLVPAELGLPPSVQITLHFPKGYPSVLTDPLLGSKCRGLNSTVLVYAIGT